MTPSEAVTELVRLIKTNAWEAAQLVDASQDNDDWTLPELFDADIALRSALLSVEGAVKVAEAAVSRRLDLIAGDLT